jgi:SRSO17 transposase
MDTQQLAALGLSFARFLKRFRFCFGNRKSFAHFQAYCRGLISDLPRKSVEPIALESGTAVRTMQEFLSHHRWDHAAARDELQRRVVAEHLPPPDAGRVVHADDVGVVCMIDETSAVKKGDKTPGVQRQYCGAGGKIDNPRGCIVTVHLSVRCGEFNTLLDSDLYLPKETWHEDRARCQAAHIPDEVVYRSKWQIALEQIDRAVGNGVRFDWLVFDEWYGAKPGFLAGLEARGHLYMCEAPANLPCFPTRPRYRSLQRPFASKRADDAARLGKPFQGQKWREISLKRKTMPPQIWRVKAAQVYLAREGEPTDRTYWLIVAKNVDTGEVKHFVSNAPPRTQLKTLLRIAFTRAGIEHAFRIVKSEIGFTHFEGRSYTGLMRHMVLCQTVMLFLAEHTDRLREKKSADHHGADRPRVELPVPPVAAPTLWPVGA